MTIGIVGVGAAASVLANQVDSIYSLFVLCSYFVYVMLFPQLTCVIYFRDVNTYGSLAGYIMGLFFQLAGGEKRLKVPSLFQYPWYDAKAKFQRFPYKTFSIVMSLYPRKQSLGGI
jgi:high affinity choline transporter 7